MVRYVTLILAFAMLVGVFWVGLQQDPSKLPSPYIGKAAPDFDLPSLTHPDQRVNSASLEGQLALVNVWATWCVGCRQEHEFLMQLATANPLPIYGINWRDNRADALRWLQQLGDPYVASGFDEDARVGIDWGVYGAPETFLVSPDGIVVYKHLGPLTAAIWERDFVPHIENANGAQ
ncbi:MAG: DsbE family thiol:disulfide interchange protein [Gammaproteobacteria bacterium]|nr:DsbE family thiol:disulfide interchange protein [Gammaproteobacteria bacterium]